MVWAHLPERLTWSFRGPDPTRGGLNEYQSTTPISNSLHFCLPPTLQASPLKYALETFCKDEPPTP